ncbi:MAG: hypothetical protein HFH73_07755 [Lachnospiraceae bacterium]|nr:hypothetical protein [Lachnospiraceae bacterium]
MSFESNEGMNKLAKVITSRIKKHGESPLVLDFGAIQPNGSLLTNTFPQEIPKGQYTVCRHLTYGTQGETLTWVKKLNHSLSDPKVSDVIIPEKMRSLLPGDRVLVAWVQDEAVVIDIIVSS